MTWLVRSAGRVFGAMTFHDSGATSDGPMEELLEKPTNARRAALDVRSEFQTAAPLDLFWAPA
jgi:hypothetical protein